MGHILWILFGPGTYGAGGNMVAWVSCGASAGLWLRGRLKAHEALARLHHQQKMAQSQANHDALIAHVTATATLAVTAAEPQVSGGSRSQPGSMGLPEESALVPPPAAADPAWGKAEDAWKDALPPSP